MKNLNGIVLCFLILLGLNANIYAWFDKTHIAVAKVAGYDRYYNAAAPDVAVIKAGKIERYNHFYHNDGDKEVTVAMVMKQKECYDSCYDGNNPEGHLYGAILKSWENHMANPKPPEYHMAYLVHYIGDLSQPLHNTPMNDFNRARHRANDGIVDNEVMNNLDKIEKHMQIIEIKNEDDLARELVRIANLSRMLGKKLEKENRNMTKEEAYKQLAFSASLFKALLSLKNTIPAK